MKKKELPLIELTINPEDGSFVSGIAIVNDPAIQSNFIAFSSTLSKEFFATNDDKMELLGAAMIPDMVIYRNSEEIGEYAVKFSKETIREIAQVFAEKGLLNSMNIEHTSTDAKSYVFQSYLVDESKGIYAPKGIKDALDGSWIIGVKVKDKSVWNDVKSGKIKGFSVEGLFDFIDTHTTVKLSNNKVVESDFDSILNEVIQATRDYLK